MITLFHKRFKKKIAKYPFLKNQIDEQIRLFLKDPFDQQLHNHALSGKWKGCRSINITGDYRAVYEMVVEDDTAYFVDMDTHSNLYQ